MSISSCDSFLENSICKVLRHPFAGLDRYGTALARNLDGRCFQVFSRQTCRSETRHMLDGCRQPRQGVFRVLALSGFLCAPSKLRLPYKDSRLVLDDRQMPTSVIRCWVVRCPWALTLALDHSSEELQSQGEVERSTLHEYQRYSLDGKARIV